MIERTVFVHVEVDGKKMSFVERVPEFVTARFVKGELTDKCKYL